MLPLAACLFLPRLILRQYGVGGEEATRGNPLQVPPDGRAQRPLLLEIDTEKRRVDAQAGDGVASSMGLEFGAAAQTVIYW